MMLGPRALAVALLVLLVAPAMPAAAQQTNAQEKTFLTFSNPVELPGVTLPAGTYVFRLADTPGRNVVQVLDRTEGEVLGQWLFVQANRLDPTGETVVTFREERAGATPAVQYWFFPGEGIGKEFVYPEDQARQIASRTGQTVLSTEGDITPDAEVFSVDARGNRTPRAAAGRAAAQQQQQVLTGCVYRTSDQPTVLALMRMDNSGDAAAQPAAPTGDAGRAAPAPAGTSGATAGPGAGSAWYRLSSADQSDVTRYVGQRVRITGTVTPGRDAAGADVVIHRLEPNRTTITAVDIQPAPELAIRSITPMSGSCE